MNLTDIVLNFVSTTLPSFSPTRILEQLLARLQQLLRIIVALAICAAMACVSLAYFIDRLLDQIDNGIFTMTHSMGLLLVLIGLFGLGVVVALRLISRKSSEEQMKSLRLERESALESALAALVMSYVKEREEKLSAAQKATNQSEAL